MKKIAKKKIGIWLIIIVIILGLINWFFPYSAVSISKSYTFDPDDMVMSQYLREYKEFKEYYEEKSTEDLTTLRMEGLLGLYDLPWLSTKEPVKINQGLLSKTLFKVKGNRNTLVDLAFKEDFDDATKEYLKLVIKDLLAIEEDIVRLQHDNNLSRKSIRILTSNLHSSILTNANFLETFYREYQGDRKQ